MRFLVLLLVSAILHAGLILAPYLGESSDLAIPVKRQYLWAKTPLMVTIGRSSPAAAEPSIELSDQQLAGNLREKSQTLTEEELASRRAGKNLLPLRGVEYFAARDLTKSAKPLEPVVLESEELGAELPAGRAVLTLWIDQNGLVKDVQVVSRDVSEIAVQNSIAVFRRTRFSPALRGNSVVGSIMRIEILFGEAADSAEMNR